MRSRYRVHGEDQTYFITSTIVEWLPVFTTAACCDVLVESLKFCQQQKSLKVHAWVILDNHFHAVVTHPELSRVMRSLKSHTAEALLAQIQMEGRHWLLNAFNRSRTRDKIIAGNRHQVWQEGYFPKAILSDEIMYQKLEYVHQNPVKRGLVVEPEHWRYSSAHEWLPGAAPVLRCDPWR